MTNKKGNSNGKAKATAKQRQRQGQGLIGREAALVEKRVSPLRCCAAPVETTMWGSWGLAEGLFFGFGGGGWDGCGEADLEDGTF